MYTLLNINLRKVINNITNPLSNKNVTCINNIIFKISAYTAFANKNAYVNICNIMYTGKSANTINIKIAIII